MYCLGDDMQKHNIIMYVKNNVVLGMYIIGDDRYIGVDFSSKIKLVDDVLYISPCAKDEVIVLDDDVEVYFYNQNKKIHEL